MRYLYRLRMKKWRLCAIIGALLLYVYLVGMNAWRTFPPGDKNITPFVGVYFGFSTVIALLFLAVGSLVWLYARNRFVALLLFCFSLATMLTFVVETGASANDPLLSVLGSVGSQLALSFLAAFLLYFPRNYLTWHSSKKGTLAQDVSAQYGRDWRYYRTLFLRGYVAMIFILCLESVCAFILFMTPFAPSLQIQTWLNTIDYIYNAIMLIGILLTIVISYRQSSSLRERQQRRLLVIGIILSFAPLLVLTVLPLALHWGEYGIDPQISTLTLVLLPLALGYSILRYQILVFDAYVRRVIAWIAGSVSLVILAYLTVALSSILLPEILSRAIFIAGAMALLAPLTWYAAHLAMEQLFFRENVHYRHLVERLDRLGSETIDLHEAARLLTQATINVFETPEVCLFVLDEDTGHYRLYPPLPQEANAGDMSEADLSRNELVRYLLRVIGSSMYEGTQAEWNWPGVNAPAMVRIEKACHPLLLSEAVKAGDEGPLGLSRYLRSTSPLGVDPLLVPVRVQGKMIGMLVLGHREDQEQYAGPDFETIDLILSRFASILETARLYAQASQHVAILNTLYSASAMSNKAFQSIEDIANAYAEIAAEATQATAIFWLYDEEDGLLRQTGYVGSGPFLTSENILRPTQDGDWTPCFYEGGSSHSWKSVVMHTPLLPPCLAGTPYFPFAWIPLNQGQQHLGVLVLTYTRPHIFSQQEKRVLEMFASQCAAALENTRMTSELRIAYERQKELDQLKDQFIITASHELRTPLTAVMGYLELLGEYAGTLSPELLADFIAKAHRGCDELSLMVGNIMDASRVQTDAEKLRLGQVLLTASVKHILEILEAMTRREKRIIQVDIPQSLIVEADDLRLRQVLLNLVNNALKYSSPGTSVEITASEDDGLVIVSVRDHGLGVPLEGRDRLFDRFMRLERDMNSPVRGAGLGLYICKQLVEAMGGRIWVESTGIAGEGSSFGFTLRRSLVTQPLSR